MNEQVVTIAAKMRNARLRLRKLLGPECYAARSAEWQFVIRAVMDAHKVDAIDALTECLKQPEAKEGITAVWLTAAAVDLIEAGEAGE